MDSTSSLSRFAAKMYRRSMVCSIADEDVFGPVVNNCLEDFDFTLLFEESILTTPLLVISLLLALARLWYLQRSPQKVKGGLLHLSKVVGFVILTSLNIALLVIWAKPSTPKTRLTTGTGILTVATSFVFGCLSYLEHLKSIRPSEIIQLSLLLSTLLDIARVRTLWSIQENILIAVIFSVSMGFKFGLLVLESVPKRRLLKPMYADPSLESTGGIFSQSLFLWMNVQLTAGYRRLLSMDDLLSVDESLCSKELEGGGLHRRWNTISKKWPGNALLIASIQEYKWAIVAGVIPRLCQIGFVFAQPFLVRRVVLLMVEENSRATTFTGYGLIAAYGLVYFGITVATAMSQHKAYRVITMLRGALVNMIYNKTMTLPSTVIGDSSPVTLMSADIERIGAGLRYIYDVWASLIEIPIALWLLWGELGVASLGPIIVAVAAILLAGGLSTIAGDRQKVWLEAIEARVDATAKMLGSVKGVKLLGMTEKVYADIQSMKEVEIKKSEKFRQLLIAAAAIAYSNTALAPVISFAIYTIRANINNTETLTTAKAFTSLTLFALVNTPIGNLVESGAGLATAIGSLARINEFLLQKPRSDGRVRSTSITKAHISGSMDGEYTPSSMHSSIALYPMIRNQDETLVARNRSAGWGNEKPSTIVDMNFDIQPSTLTMIIGPVGCGKSTLLNALLGETPEYDGYLLVTTKDVAYCGQTPWLTNKTLQQNVIGESHFYPQWYSEVIRACALEQDIDELPNGDQSMLGSKGATLSGGQKQRISLARAVYSNKSTVILDDVLSGLDSTTEEQIMTNVFGAEGIFRKRGTTVIMATNNVRRIPLADHIIVLGADGSIVQQGSFEHLNANPGYVQSLLVQEQDVRTGAQGNNENILAGLSEELEETPDADSRMTGDLSVYLYYAKAIGIWRAIIFLLLMGTYVFFLSYPAIWVEKWSAVNDVTPGYDLALYLGIYFFLAAGAMVFIILSAWHLMANMVSKAARVFHMRLLRTVLNAPMSFFTTTDQGVTTNRFTQDLQLVDMELPLALLNTCLSSLTCLAQLIVISYSTKYLAATVPAVIAVFYFVQRFYLRTSRQLRFMDIEAKSPLFSNFLESLSGLVTIRAYGWEKSYKEKSRELLEESQKPFYLLYCVQRWLEVVVGCSVAGFAVLLVGVAVATRGKIDAGFVGVALVNIVTFSENIQGLIIHWTVLETSIGAVSRIRAFTTTTENENQPSEQRKPPPDWPSSGRVEFQEVVASYKKTSNPVLKGVSINIAPGEKLGICGRTGSGKSSLISTLFRTLELDSGSIFVDGIDLSMLPRQEIRSRLIVIPQEPYLLRGTVRFNVDPSKSLSDDAIIKALQKTQLWDVICKQGGLDANVTDDFLSHGQRQLLCLAGSILRNGTILVLDEATSSVDSQTDELMQKVIRSEFPHHTIIAIAHRLDSILDFDKVMVLDKGCVAEVGNPQELLRPGRPGNPISKFRSLYMDASPSRSLEDIPETNEIANETANETANGQVGKRASAVFTLRDQDKDIYDVEDEEQKPSPPPKEMSGESSHQTDVGNTEPETPFPSRKSLLDLFSSTVDELDSIRPSRMSSNATESHHNEENVGNKRNTELVTGKSLIDLFSSLEGLESAPTQTQSQVPGFNIIADSNMQDNASIISRPSDLANRPSLIDLFSSTLNTLSNSSDDSSDAGSVKGKNVDYLPVRRMTLQRTVSLSRTMSVLDGPSLMHLFRSTLDGLESSGAAMGVGESSSRGRVRRL